MTSDLRSAPIITLSLASSNSACVTMRLLRRAAINAASFTRFIKSAPEKPGVPRATVLRLTSGASGTLRTCTFRMLSRPTTSGLGTTTWAQQRRIEYIGAVSCRDKNNAFIGFEAIHLDEQLVERLLALVIAAAETGATMPADSIDFVNEDNTRRILLGLLEHVADTACAHTNEHFNEVGAGNGEERHVGFAGNRARDQCLAGARWADQQYAARNASAQALEFSGIAQELDDLLQILFSLVDTGDILES